MKQNSKTITSIITLGCKVNQYESDSLANLLEKRGHEVKKGLVFANNYVINSCAVTSEGERKSRGYISKILKINPEAKIFVCGCASQNAPETFKNKKNIKVLCGTAGKMTIAEEIDKFAKKEDEPISTNLFDFPKAYEDTMESKQTRTRAILKIQDGCNQFCSYCIIPYLRGRSRSRKLESIKAELDKIKSSEVVFAGVDMSAYGKDLVPEKSLSDVAELMRGRSARFRFSSLEMGSVTKSLLSKLKTLKNFCPHFHLSMQSGSDTVLRRMNRKHTVKDFVECVEEIRKVFPKAGITTDVIVGFPGETEEEANETIETVKKIVFLDIHIFPYSKRTGTSASRLKSLDGTIVKLREKELANVAKQLRKKVLESEENMIREVLIEGKEKGFFIGYTENYIKTYIRSAKQINPGEKIKVKMKGLFEDGMEAIIGDDGN